MAACATTPGGTGISVASVQSAAVLACSFQPTADTVAGILAVGNPAIATAEAVAAAICAAVTGKAAKRGAAVPTVAGVPVKGSFVH